MGSAVRKLSAAWRELSWPERGLVVAGLVWLGIFVEQKTPNVLSLDWIEWDARAMALAAFRMHGTGLFPRDLGAELASAMCPPGWKLVYWLGTFFTDAYQVSRLLPFAIFGFMCWQVFAFVSRRSGVVVAVLSVYLVVRCPFVWDRIVGANPRAFGIPLVVAFLRYASEGRRGATALVLIAQAAFYPSVLLVCAPAWAMLMLYEAWRERSRMPLVWLASAGAVCGLLVLPTALLVDPRIGPAIRIEQLAVLKQRAIWSLYPLMPHRWVFERAIWIPLQDDMPKAFVSADLNVVLNTVLAVLAAIAFGVGLLRRRVPLVFVLLFGTSVGAYLFACAVAYRLYVPDRLVHYTWTPIILVLFGALCVELVELSRHATERARLLVVVALVVLTVVANGTGLGSFAGLHNWSGHRNKTLGFLATVGKDALVAAHPSLSSDVEVFAKRSVLFSGITNAPNFATYGVTVENRIGSFYEAYYAVDPAQLRRFLVDEKVDYLVVDQRDFGPTAMERAKYVTPWTELAQRLLRRTPASSMALAHVPPEAIAFRDGPVLVVDAHKL